MKEIQFEIMRALLKVENVIGMWENGRMKEK